MTKRDVLLYEVSASSWWCSWIFWGWGTDLAGHYFAWKVKRKWNRFQRWEKIRARMCNAQTKT